MNRLRIRSVEAHNVKGLRDVRVEPGDDVTMVVIKGPNGGGKTSLLDTIKFCLAGARSQDPMVIRLGEDEAAGKLDLGDLFVSKSWHRNSEGKEVAQLEVTAKDGTKYPSPQKILDGIHDALSFDAANVFLRMKPKDQLDLLKKLVGVDTGLLEAQRQKIFDARTVVNRDLAAATARLAGMPNTPPPPATDTGALVKEQAVWLERVAALRTAREARQAAAAEVARRKAAIAAAEAAVKAAQAAQAAAERAWQDALVVEAQADNAYEEAGEQAEVAPAKLSAIEKQLAAAGEVATANARWAERERTAAEVARLDADARQKTTAIHKLDADKEALVRGARFPVEGLGFGVDGVLFKGVPFEQVAQSEKIRITVAICIARDPKLRVITVPDGILLNEESFGLLRDLCEEHGIQCWIEIVGTDGPASVVIVDGEAVRS